MSNSKNSARKLPELINNLSNVSGYTVNWNNSTVFLYTTSKCTEKEIMDTVPFTTASKKVNSLGLILTKEGKDL